MMRKCKKFLLILLSLVVLSCAAVACEKGDISIIMNKSEATLEVGSTLQLEPTISGLDNTLLKWSSSSAENATVSESGLVTAVKKGSCIITATIGEYKADCALTVTDSAVPSIQLAEGLRETTVGGEIQLTATVYYKAVAMSDVTLTYSSSADAIATVSATGKLAE